jgi:hypothetical protein
MEEDFTTSSIKPALDKRREKREAKEKFNNFLVEMGIVLAIIAFSLVVFFAVTPRLVQLN